MVKDLGMKPMLILVAALILVLPGCTGGSDSQNGEPLFQQLFNAGRQALATRRGRRDARPPLTRAALDTVGRPALEATLERSGIFAYLFIDAVRDDAGPGRVTIWRTEDNVTLALRSGVLIATRGLGGDLLSSDVAIARGRPGPAGSGARTAHVRTGNVKAVSVTLACDLADLGPDPVEIVEIIYPTRHLQERCTGADGGQVVNDYWVDSRAGIIWQSRQWAGPGIGYVALRRLIK
jgi:hypothetical protein